VDVWEGRRMSLAEEGIESDNRDRPWGGIWAEARFDAKSGYACTKKQIDEWTSNIEPTFKSHYKKRYKPTSRIF